METLLHHLECNVYTQKNLTIFEDNSNNNNNNNMGVNNNLLVITYLMLVIFIGAGFVSADFNEKKWTLFKNRVEKFIGHSLDVTNVQQCQEQFITQLSSGGSADFTKITSCGLLTKDVELMQTGWDKIDSKNVFIEWLNDDENKAAKTAAVVQQYPGVVGISTTYDNTCNRINTYFGIDPGNCYEMDNAVTNDLVDFSLSPYLTGQNFVTFSLSCTSPTSGTVEFYDTVFCSSDPILTLPISTAKGKCYQTSGTDDSSNTVAKTNFKFSCDVTICRPDYGLTKDQCSRRMSVCNSRQTKMKWTGTGCVIGGKRMRDGGCQCAKYCGYLCASACNADPICHWDNSNQVCRNAQNQITSSDVQCPTESAATPNQGAYPVEPICFPGNVNVRSKDGVEIPMSELLIGEEVQVADPVTGKIEFSPVIGFLHLERNRQAEYLRVELEDASHLVLSDDHIVFATLDFDGVAPTDVLARDLIVGRSRIWKSVDNQQMKLVLVAKIIKISGHGVYAPMTQHGTILVNNALTSCYAYLKHDFLHATMLPYRWYCRLFPFTKKEVAIQDGLMPYIEHLKSFFMLFPQMLPFLGDGASKQGLAV